MKLSEKIRYLREVEGSLRGLNRAMTQQELVRAIAEDSSSGTISQSYLSQIESGARPHLTNTTRLLLARFFKVHPGYLVEDPEDYQVEFRTAELAQRQSEDKLDLWLIAGAERFGKADPKLCRALLTLAQHEDSRRWPAADGVDPGDTGADRQALPGVESVRGSSSRCTGASKTGEGKEERQKETEGEKVITLYLICFVLGLVLTLFAAFSGAGPLAHRSPSSSPATSTPSLRLMSQPSTALRCRRSSAGSVRLDICWTVTARLFQRSFFWLLSRPASWALRFCMWFSSSFSFRANVSCLLKTRAWKERSHASLTRSVPVTVRARFSSLRLGLVRAAAARSEDGAPIPRGTEVVVLRYERGIAYIRPLHELSN